MIAPTSILCPECEKRLMRKPKEENRQFYRRVTRLSDGTVVVDDSFFRALLEKISVTNLQRQEENGRLEQQNHGRNMLI